MAGNFADYLENKLLNLTFGAVTFAPATVLYIGLSSTAVDDAGGGITEPIGNGYARALVNNNTTNFPSTSSGTIANGTVVMFPQATGQWASGADLTHFFVADAPVGGNIYAAGTLTTPKKFSNGDQPNFPVGSLTFSLD